MILFARARFLRAIRGKRLRKVEEFLTATPSLAGARDRKGETALYLAAACVRSTEITQALLSAGADPNARNARGSTALHGAASCGDHHLDIVKLLLDSGANPNAKNEEGLTPLDVVRKCEPYGLTTWNDAVELLQSRGGRFSQQVQASPTMPSETPSRSGSGVTPVEQEMTGVVLSCKFAINRLVRFLRNRTPKSSLIIMTTEGDPLTLEESQQLIHALRQKAILEASGQLRVKTFGSRVRHRPQWADLNVEPLTDDDRVAATLVVHAPEYDPTRARYLVTLHPNTGVRCEVVLCSPVPPTAISGWKRVPLTIIHEQIKADRKISKVVAEQRGGAQTSGGTRDFASTAKPLTSAQQAALFSPARHLELLCLAGDSGIKGVASPCTDGGIIQTQPLPPDVAQWALPYARRIRVAGDLFREGRFHEALRQFTLISRDLPDAAIVLMNVGVCYAELGDKSSARCCLEKSLRVVPPAFEYQVRQNLSRLDDLATSP